MARVIWSDQSYRNLAAIGDYVRQSSPEYASSLLLALIEAATVLETFPRIGRVVPEFDNPSIRELIFEGYRIVYEPRDDSVVVLSVMHSAMDVANRLRNLQGTDL